MKKNMTDAKHIKTNVRLALTLSAGLALTAALSGCGQSSNASQPSSSADPAPEQTPTVEQTAAAPAAPTAPSAEHGQQLFTTTCSGCHGPEGKGIPHLGKDLQTSKFVAGLSDSQLVDFINQGRSTSDPLNTTHIAMPPKGGNPALSPQDVADIAAYIRQLQKQRLAGK